MLKFHRIHQYGHLEESLGMTRQKTMRAPELVMMRCDLDMAEYQVKHASILTDERTDFFCNNGWGGGVREDTK